MGLGDQLLGHRQLNFCYAAAMEQDVGALPEFGLKLGGLQINRDSRTAISPSALSRYVCARGCSKNFWLPLSFLS